MAKMIFVNLPVADVAKSTAFYEAIGFEKNEQFSNAQSSSLKWSDEIYLMVLDKGFFATIAHKTAADPRAAVSAVFALAFDSRAEVDDVTAKAIAAGGSEVHEAEDMGFMYSRGFTDLDGHAFGPFWMDVEAATTAMAQTEPA